MSTKLILFLTNHNTAKISLFSVSTGKIFHVPAKTVHVTEFSPYFDEIYVENLNLQAQFLKSKLWCLVFFVFFAFYVGKILCRYPAIIVSFHWAAYLILKFCISCRNMATSTQEQYPTLVVYGVCFMVCVHVAALVSFFKQIYKYYASCLAPEPEHLYRWKQGCFCRCDNTGSICFSFLIFLNILKCGNQYYPIRKYSLVIFTSTYI